MVARNNRGAPQPASDQGLRRTLILLVGVLGVMLMAASWIVKIALSGSRAAAPAEVAEAAPEPSVEPATPALPAYAARATPRDLKSRRGAPRQPHAVAALSHTNNPPVRTLSIEEKYGIRVLALRLMMANRYLDMRYRVVDSAKAAQLSNGQTPSFLMDRASGTRLLMPKPPAEGAFPPTSSHLATNRAYFSMILNQGGAVTNGSQVELLVGNTQPMRLVVQ